MPSAVAGRGKGEEVPQEHIGLFDTPPSRRELQLALAALAALFAAFFLVLPVSDTRAIEIVPFTPVVDAVVCTGELIIATMLFAQAAIFRSRALAMLASGFVYAGLMLIPHALTSPGAFAPHGLFDAGPSATGWSMIFRRYGLPIAIFAYVILRKGDAPQADRRSPRAAAWAGAALMLALASAFVAIEGREWLPQIFVDRTTTNHVTVTFVIAVNLIVAATALGVLFVNRRSVLDLWLLVLLVGWMVQSSLNLFVHSRTTVGFYGVFLIVFFSHLFVLYALIEESNRLYARLALSTAARDRERETRMMSMDAVATAISHEVGQPLTAVALNARASLNFLTRSPPDIEMATRTLEDVIDAGQRTFDVIKGIRATFIREAESLTEFSLDQLVRETASLLAKEFAARKISLELALDETQSPILANRVQIQRVLVNLLTNMTEADGASGRVDRRVAIRSATLDDENALLEISDTGTGFAAGQLDRIFDPLFRVGSARTGLGLSLSRSIVDEHGGRLWASQDDDLGTIFHLTLPKRGRPAALA